MLDVTVRDDLLRIGPYFGVSFQRTLRIPDDGGLATDPFNATVEVSAGQVLVLGNGQHVADGEW